MLMIDLPSPDDRYFGGRAKSRLSRKRRNPPEINICPKARHRASLAVAGRFTQRRKATGFEFYLPCDSVFLR
jgi:hypothetical protein